MQADSVPGESSLTRLQAPAFCLYPHKAFLLSRQRENKRSQLLLIRPHWLWEFPGGLAVKNLPADAGDTGSGPGLGTKIPHAVEQQASAP